MENKENKREKRRGGIKAVILALAIGTIFAIAGVSFARYYSEVKSDKMTGNTIQVARWAVKVNSTDIVPANATLSVTFKEVTNANVVDGKIAPASSLYADFEIDPTGSEVAIDYEFTIGTLTMSSGTPPADLKIEKVVTVGSDSLETAITETSGKYSGTIALASQTAALTSTEKVTVRVYVKWENKDTNNAADTTFGAAAPTVTVPISIVVKQHIA